MPHGEAESIQLVDELVEAKIPKSTAARLVDRIEKNEPDTLENDLKWTKLENDLSFIKNDLHWLKWIVTSLVALMLAIIGIVTYLHNDTKIEIQSIRTEMKTEINSKIDKMLIQRR